MNVVGVQHVSIGVHDVDASIEFYGWLGLTVNPARPDFGFPGAWLFAGGEQVHLIQSPKQTPGIENHFALVVDDLETCLADLAVHGVDVSNRMHVPGAGKQAFLKDPSGNVIELNQPD